MSETHKLEDALNGRLRQAVTDRASTLLADGSASDEEEAVQAATEEIVSGFTRDADGIADRLAAADLAHGSARKEYELGVEGRLLEFYGEGLDLYLTTVEVVASAARELWARYQRREESDLLTEVLWGNLAQCIRLAREVGCLLRHGYPYGALAMHRTAYELSVRSTVLREHGRDDNHTDLAERYVLHDRVTNAEDATEYHRSAEVLGFEPMAETDLERAKSQRDELIERYGKSFRAPYGWAVGLPGVSAGTFKEIESLAAVDHRRGFYRWASHFVHGDSASLRMSVVKRAGVSMGVVSDLTNVGLTDPAQLVLHALEMTYLSAAFTQTPELADLFISAGLGRLVTRVGQTMWEGEQRVSEAEERLQSELAAGDAETSHGPQS